MIFTGILRLLHGGEQNILIESSETSDRCSEKIHPLHEYLQSCKFPKKKPSTSSLFFHGSKYCVHFIVPHKIPCLKIHCERTSLHSDLWPSNSVRFQGWMFYVATVLIFWVTLAVFPAITALVRSSNASNGSTVTNKLFIPLACFVVFNFTDLFGRLLAKYVPIVRWLPSNKQTLALLTLIQ